MTFKDAPWMNEELNILADATEKFFAAELIPNQEKYLAQKFVDREFWQKAGEYGLLAASIPEEYGGMGGNCTHNKWGQSELTQLNSAINGVRINGVRVKTNSA